MYNLCDLPYCNKFTNCHTFEKLTDTFCLKSSLPWAVTLPSKNSTLTDTISVELLEYWTVYDTLKEEKKSMINSETGKKVSMAWWVAFTCNYNLVTAISTKKSTWLSPVSFLVILQDNDKTHTCSICVTIIRWKLHDWAEIQCTKGKGKLKGTSEIFINMRAGIFYLQATK